MFKKTLADLIAEQKAVSDMYKSEYDSYSPSNISYMEEEAPKAMSRMPASVVEEEPSMIPAIPDDAQYQSYSNGNKLKLSLPIDEPNLDVAANKIKEDMSPPQMNPLVRKHLLGKMKSNSNKAPASAEVTPVQTVAAQSADPYALPDELSDEAFRDAQLDSSKKRLHAQLAAAANTIGSGIGNRQADNTAFNQMYQDADSQVKDIERRRKAMRSDVDDKTAQEKYKAIRNEQDPNSANSVAFRKIIEAQFPDVVKHYGSSWANVAASDRDNIFQPLKLKEEIEARKAQTQMLADARRDAQSDKRTVNEDALRTPYGMANTVDDAKRIKEGYESKKTFDSKIQEMIDLRVKHGGGATFNREDVTRGKQLSKELLLEYKNLAKLGVLSQSDEKILNAIIPHDPLEYDLIPGQDPILSNMKKFKADSDKDFNTRVETRIRPGMVKRPVGDRSVVKKQYSPSRNQTKVIYSDGTEEIIQGKN
jgi:hypothetical protein